MSFLSAERHEGFVRVLVSQGHSDPNYRDREIDLYSDELAAQLAGGKKLLRITKIRGDKLVVGVMGSAEEYVVESVRSGPRVLSSGEVIRLHRALCGIGIELQA